MDDKWLEDFLNTLHKNNVKVFSYEDYLKYQDFINKREKKKTDKLEETNEVYILGKEENKINNQDDKICRKMLDIKIEAREFINKVLNINLAECKLEKYNSSFITTNLENRESDIIYKIKGKNIFILIEHQTKKDLSMPWRITEYVVEIIKSAIDYSKIGQKNYKLPLVIPIVLYTGKEKWNIKTYINEVQEKLDEYDELEFGRYKIVDVNDFTEEELLKEKTYLSKFMLIEKYKKGDNLSDCLDNIVKEIVVNKDIYKGKGKDVLLLMISKVLAEKIGEEKTKEIIKELKGDGGEMLQVLETIREENEELRQQGRIEGREEGRQEGRKEGRQEGRQEGKQEERLKIIKEMLKRNMPVDLISEITNSTKNTIRKIANLN